MPEAVTIIQNENPALSPENEEMLAALAGEGDDKPAELLAGKYKSVEDLEKAYKELEAKLGRGESTRQTPRTTTPPLLLTTRPRTMTSPVVMPVRSTGT
jgi:hypothetical protein